MQKCFQWYKKHRTSRTCTVCFLTSSESIQCKPAASLYSVSNLLSAVCSQLGVSWVFWTCLPHFEMGCVSPSKNFAPKRFKLCQTVSQTRPEKVLQFLTWGNAVGFFCIHSTPRHAPRNKSCTHMQLMHIQNKRMHMMQLRVMNNWNLAIKGALHIRVKDGCEKRQNAQRLPAGEC